MKRLRQWQALCLMFTVLLLFCGCGQDREARFVSKGDPLDPYGSLVARTFPQYPEDPVRVLRSPFSELPGGGLMECYDIQALSARENGLEARWFPQCRSTAVIAVDRAQTDAVLTSWRDLAACGEPVALNQADPADKKLLAAAVSYGLEGEDYTLESFLTLFRQIEDRGLFRENQWSAPVMVLMDHQAAALIRRGQDLEIIIPREGTLSFDLGLLSREELSLPDEETLLSAGLRLPDGRCTAPGYPALEEYDRAVSAPSPEHLLRATEYLTRSLRREVQGKYLCSSADNREHILFALIAIVIAMLWTSSAAHRSISPQIQKVVRLIGGLIVGWIAARLVKYQFPQAHPAAMYAWYCFYIFQMGLPVAFLYLTSLIDPAGESPKTPFYVRAVLAAYPVLLLLVLTNDLHHLVFCDFHTVLGILEYSYGPGYYIVYAFCFLAFLASGVLMAKKSLRSPNRLAWVPSAVLGVLLLLYTVGYAMNITPIRRSDYTIIFCLFMILFLETSLRTGMVPSNTRYDFLFSASPLDLQLLDDRGRTVLASRSASSLDSGTRSRSRESGAVTLMQDENTILCGQAIRGGTVIWEEDIRALNALREKIADSVRRLEAANALLGREENIRRRELDLQARTELFVSLENEIEERAEELSEAIEALPQSPDRSGQTAYITLLLCHIKRRCNLFFLARENTDLPADELAMYLDELAEFATYAGVSALCRSSARETIEIHRATLLYDFFFTVLAWAVKKSRATLIGVLSETGAGLECSILSSEPLDSLRFPELFRSSVAESGGQLTCKELDEESGISLTFSKGGTPA